MGGWIFLFHSERMIEQFIRSVIRVVAYGLVLLSVGTAIWYLVNEPKPSLQDVLFWVGTVSIALFSLGMCGNFSGMGSSSYQMARSVMKRSPNQRAFDDAAERQGKSASGIIWVASGLLIWLISYLM
jgi:hypothetical protein